MVFNEEFDRALWLVLASDVFNREDIASLVYNIPKELFKCIFEQLKMYDVTKDNLDYSFKNFRKAFRENDGDNCFYNIEMNPEEINIKLNRWGSSGVSLEETVELCLVSLSVNDLLNINLEASTYIGNYSYHSSQFLTPESTVLLVDIKEKEYQIKADTPIGLVMYNSEGGKFFRIVNMKKMPSEMELSDLSSKRSVNKLVRTRKNR